jgi:acetaldehyde dehydrogenase (acetylating)
MGHTAGIHTRSRDAAIKFGGEMPASRITVNTPTTHGAIGFSTALPPSMTLGCGSWGGNVTSDNVSPLHLMDIKRVAFETRPVKSARPAVTIAETKTPAAPVPEPVAVAPSAAPKIGRQEIAAIVDRFLAGRPTPPAPEPAADPIEAGSMYAGPATAAPPPSPRPQPQAGNGGAGARPAAPATEPAPNGRKAIDFVSEDDVRRAIQKGEKIYVGPRTIITPAARDMGEPAEVFAKA